MNLDSYIDMTRDRLAESELADVLDKASTEERGFVCSEAQFLRLLQS